VLAEETASVRTKVIECPRSVFFLGILVWQLSIQAFHIQFLLPKPGAIVRRSGRSAGFWMPAG
jgi:hypothetical protein